MVSKKEKPIYGNLAMTLKEKVLLVIEKYGYETSYAKNMLGALQRYEQGDSNFSVLDFRVTMIDKKIHLRFAENNQFTGYYEITWDLHKLIGEYELNANAEFFSK